MREQLTPRFIAPQLGLIAPQLGLTALELSQEPEVLAAGKDEAVGGRTSAGFWQDLWQSTNRLLSTSCPSCETNNADLPSSRRIIRKLITQQPRVNVRLASGERPVAAHAEDDEERSQTVLDMHIRSKTVWDKHIGYKCQSCGYQWEVYKRDQPLPG